MNRSLLIGLVCLGPALATAQASDMHLDLEAGTDFPVAIGATVAFEAPYGIRASTSLGAMPGGYVSLINEVVIAIGGYDDLTATLIEQTLQNSLVWRTHVGWIADFGLYVDVGYALVTLGGGTSAEAVMAAVTGKEPDVPGPERVYDVGSTLHMIDAEIGWKGVFWDAFVVRAALGFAGTLAASTTVEQTFDVKGPALQKGIDEFERWAEDYLNDTYTTYVFTPVLTLSLGYRFF